MPAEPALYSGQTRLLLSVAQHWVFSYGGGCAVMVFDGEVEVNGYVIRACAKVCVGGRGGGGGVGRRGDWICKWC